jgi:hypothetical protein
MYIIEKKKIKRYNMNQEKEKSKEQKASDEPNFFENYTTLIKERYIPISEGKKINKIKNLESKKYLMRK